MKLIKKEDIQSILIIGIKGVLAQLTTQLLAKEYPRAKIIGIDSREIGNLPQFSNVHYHSIKYTRGGFETLFRNHSFDLVYHIGRIIHQDDGALYKFSKKLDIGLMETRRILDLCLNFSVKKVVIMSTYHVYGANPDNPAFIKEDYPLRASVIYPPLLSVVEVDQIASNWMWKNQDKVSTVILRPCNIIGPQIHNTICKYLTSWYSPRPLDYNPMFQFIHESDMANILFHAPTHLPTGVFNIASEEFIPIREALQLTGAKGLPTSMFLVDKIASLIRKTGKTLPDYLIDYLKHSCLIDGQKIRGHLPPKIFQYTLRETLHLLSCF